MTKTRNPLAFHAFCYDVFMYGGADGIETWAKRLGCPATTVTGWCSGEGVPTEAELVRAHFAVMEARELDGATRDRWRAMLELPVGQAIQLRHLLQIEGDPSPDPEPGANDATVGDVIEAELFMEVSSALHGTADGKHSGLPRKHRIELLRRFAQHAETLSHYAKKG